MRARLCALVAAVGLTLGGCGSSYQPERFDGGMLGRAGGYAEEQVAPHAYLVRYSGNRWTDREDAEWRTVYRAAELTVREGGDFFIVVASNFRHYAGTAAAGGDPRVGPAPSPPPTFRSSSPAGGPVAEAYVRLYSGPAPRDLEGAYDARVVLSEGL